MVWLVGEADMLKSGVVGGGGVEVTVKLIVV